MIKRSNKHITDSDGRKVGYVSKKSVYDDFDEEIFRIEKSPDRRTSYLVNIVTGRVFGTVDKKSGNIFSDNSSYVGTIEPSAKRKKPITLLFIMFLLATVSLCILTCFIGRNKSDKLDEMPVLICMPQSDGELDWSQNSTLNIFSQSKKTLPDGTTESYTVGNSISPDDAGAYSFVLKNENDRAIEYKVSISDVNIHNIPIMYKMKIGGEYIAGDDSNWIKINDFVAPPLELTKNSSMQFELFWRWDGSDDAVDTKIGSQELAEYMLTITLSAAYVM